MIDNQASYYTFDLNLADKDNLLIESKKAVLHVILSI